MLETGYTLSGISPVGFDDTVARVREELEGRGFGVLCDIDVRRTLREKLGVETEPYLILGACNPPLAHRALGAEPDLGVLLPCNVVVYEQEGVVRVSAVDPEQMLAVTGNEELAPVAAEVAGLLRQVVEAVVA